VVGLHRLARQRTSAGVALRRDIAAGETVCWSDVEILDSEAVRARRDMEPRFAAPAAAIAAQ
jgi:hypothetical protein